MSQWVQKDRTWPSQCENIGVYSYHKHGDVKGGYRWEHAGLALLDPNEQETSRTAAQWDVLAQIPIADISRAIPAFGRFSRVTQH